MDFDEILQHANKLQLFVIFEYEFFVLLDYLKGGRKIFMMLTNLFTNEPHVCTTPRK